MRGCRSVSPHRRQTLRDLPAWQCPPRTARAVGGNWERDVAFAGYAVPLQGDFPARQMIDLVPGVDPARKERLIQARLGRAGAGVTPLGSPGLTSPGPARRR